MPTPVAKTALITGITGQDGSYLAEDAVQQSRANRFPRMDWNHCGSAIRVAEKVMAAFHPDGLKPQLSGGEGWQPTHASTQTR